ncbi:MAG: SMC-Scp complex subunit ScpB [Verrucomicrobia bacterium]|jgi:segregation and condensation protein B|nr:SMC-Scp complex subunit ScpB [Verrucomicrobiota bacterium]
MEWARVLEALLFAATEPMEPARLATLLRDGPEGGQGWPEVKEGEVREELTHLGERLAQRGLILREVAGGFRIGTAPDLSGWVAKLKGVVRPPRLSPPALETMAVIAYRQPISRAEIEAVRGVDCSGTLDTLVERGVIRISGRSDAPGRPILYSTTPLFLEHFGLRDLEELPNSEELRRVKLPTPVDPATPQQKELLHEAIESSSQG